MEDQKITPFLWYDDNAEEAADFYVSIFPNSKVLEKMPGPEGRAMGVTFNLDGQIIRALNGGPRFKLNEAFSLFVLCDSQGEIDHYWEKLIEGGGEPDMCGWLKDRFGLSWQIVPRNLGSMLSDSDPEKANRAMQAMLKMKKLDIKGLQDAFEGKNA